MVHVCRLCYDDKVFVFYDVCVYLCVFLMLMYFNALMREIFEFKRKFTEFGRLYIRNYSGFFEMDSLVARPDLLC